LCLSRKRLLCQRCRSCRKMSNLITPKMLKKRLLCQRWRSVRKMSNLIMPKMLKRGFCDSVDVLAGKCLTCRMPKTLKIMKLHFFSWMFTVY
jgi:hypothetical protein